MYKSAALLLWVQTKILVPSSLRSCSMALPRVNVLPVPYGPMISMGGRLSVGGAVMARIASFCLGFNLVSS